MSHGPGKYTAIKVCIPVLLFHKRHFHACVFSSLQLSAFLLPGYNWWWISTDRATNWLTPVAVLSRVVKSFVDKLHFGRSILTIKSWKLEKNRVCKQKLLVSIHVVSGFFFLWTELFGLHLLLDEREYLRPSFKNICNWKGSSENLY